MPFLTCGFPSMRNFGELARGVTDSGADVLEIGFPHSDPLADGPVIQRASHTALARGFKVSGGFDLLEELSSVGTPLIIMCYSNVILRYGPEKFTRRAADSNVAGLIVPDMIIEESGEIRTLCQSHGLSFINLITPTTTEARAREILQATSGFVYVVSVTGTTGARNQLDQRLPQLVGFLKSETDLPICVGFGVSSPEMARSVGSYSDGVIVGSKLLSLVDPDKEDGDQKDAFSFVKELRKALEGAHG